MLSAVKMAPTDVGGYWSVKYPLEVCDQTHTSEAGSSRFTLSSDFDRWMLLLILGTFTGAYPLMYFAQEFIPLNPAILSSSTIVLIIIAIRSVTIMGFRLGLFSTIIPASAILALTLLAAIHTRLQGIIITAVGIALFIVAMLLIPRLKLDKTPLLKDPLGSNASPA